MTRALLLALLLQAAPASKTIQAADVAITAADFQKALKILKALDPKTATPEELLKAHLLRAECLVALRRAPEAEIAYADALRLKPDLVLEPGTAPTLQTVFLQVKGGMVGTLDISSNVMGAQAVVDGKPVGALPAQVWVLAGKHLVELASDEATLIQEIDVGSGYTTKVELNIANPKRPPAPASVVTLPKAQPPPPQSSGLRTVSYLAGGVGVAALAGYGVAGGLALSSYKGVELASASGDAEAYERQRGDLKSRSLAADVLLGVGVAALGTAVILFFVSKPAVAVSVAPTKDGASLAVAGTF